MLAGRKPPNGKTLALLCLKSVKHREVDNKSARNPQVNGNAKKNTAVCRLRNRLPAANCGPTLLFGFCRGGLRRLCFP
jgi:hypothetical protein